MNASTPTNHQAEHSADPVIVIGGGLAGLAAAVGLGAQGQSVLILESRPRLGGRASSFVDPKTGVEIDNCQHVSLDCCTNFNRFCELTGLDRYLRTERVLHFLGPDGKRSTLAASPLPAPLHLFPSFAKLGYLSLADKRALARGLKALAKWSPSEHDEGSFADWLATQNQPEIVVKRFWEVVLVSALSEDMHRIDVRHARKVFVDAFLAHRDGWRMRIPTVPLSQFYGSKLTNWFDRHSVTVRQTTGVRRVTLSNGSATGVELRTGEVVGASAVVSAVPQYLVKDLLPDEIAEHPAIAPCDTIETAPISSVHLWYDRPITELPHAVFIDRLSQWLFNRGAIETEAEPIDDRPGHLFQVVISASRSLSGRDREEIIAEVVSELEECFPEAHGAKLLRSRLITEHRAVFSVLPGIEAIRPPQQSPVPNLQLAGDWTDTGWPATMEGAIKSGFLAAENLLRHRGQSVSLVDDGLPVARLPRWLFGLKKRSVRVSR